MNQSCYQSLRLAVKGKYRKIMATHTQLGKCEEGWRTCSDTGAEWPVQQQSSFGPVSRLGLVLCPTRASGGQAASTKTACSCQVGRGRLSPWQKSGWQLRRCLLSLPGGRSSPPSVTLPSHRVHQHQPAYYPLLRQHRSLQGKNHQNVLQVSKVFLQEPVMHLC